MIPDRFSASKFEEAGLDTEAARKLSDDLERHVQRLVDQEMHVVAEKIVRELNEVGHNLREEPSDVPGEIVFFDHDPNSPEWHQNTKLRLAFDSVISAGYRHLTPPKDEGSLNAG